jgi:hypothetical protein
LLVTLLDGAGEAPYAGLTGQAAEIKRIKDFLQTRATFMDSQWVGPVSVSVPEGNVAVGTEVTLPVQLDRRSIIR